MYSVPETGKYVEMDLNYASTYFEQADFDYPVGACLIQAGLYIKIKSQGHSYTFTKGHSYFNFKSCFFFQNLLGYLIQNIM